MTGNDIIDEERRRLYQLKQRAAQEVQQQWDLAHDQTCKSLNSLESEESSIGSSETPSEKETRYFYTL